VTFAAKSGLALARSTAATTSSMPSESVLTGISSAWRSAEVTERRRATPDTPCSPATSARNSGASTV
jgi:hypothetical protein